MEPRQTIGASSGTRKAIEMSFTPSFSTGTIFPSRCSGPVVLPIIIGMFGPYTSASMRPTLAPVKASAQARFAATVDLPTPPFPLLMAMTCLTPGIRVSLPWGCWAEECSSAMAVLLPLLLHHKRWTSGKKMGPLTLAGSLGRTVLLRQDGGIQPAQVGGQSQYGQRVDR